VLKNLQVRNTVVHKADGEEALDYLRTKDTEKPCLILLDLYMPRMGGIEFLKLVKANETLKRIPVVILTDATDQDEIVKCFEFGVAGYVVKPVDSKEFAQAISTIDTYWTVSEVPYSF
jgi:CheY-like chemotaxis protein